MTIFQFSGSASGKRVFLSGTSISRHLLQATLLATFTLGVAAPAHAVFWFDEDPMRPRVMEPAPPPVPPQVHRDNRLKQQGAALEKAAKAHAKPVGPIVIMISVDKQTMRVFDANGLFAESKVSTGMKGHETPTGAFSIIQKNKWHKSNIYSNAPMPYMQRVTWSGIALHAGVVPGYPASHGCIRMPMAFSTKLWSWTRMGARVIITPGEISPAEFSHPQLIAQKPVPVATAPMAAPKDDAPAKPAGKTTEMKPDDIGLKPATSAERSKTVTADATNAIAVPAKPVVSDVGSAMAQMSAAGAEVVKQTDKKPDEAARVTRQDVDAAAAKIGDAQLPGAKKAPEARAEDVPPKSPLVTAAPEAKKDEARPADAPKMEAKPDAKPETAKLDAVDIPPPADMSPKRTGQIAVLISGKDGKLYVRQNFSPLFETDITIKASDRPLGTHIFTARVDKDEAKSIHWTAVSLPAVPHRAVAGRKQAATADVPPLPGSASEALDRINIPEDAMAQIAEAIATGGSIIVSDQSIKAGGETGQGTEFVVPMR